MAASSGMLTFKGRAQTYSINFYIPDAVADVIRFDAGAGASATSPDFKTFPEDVVLTDVAALAAPTATRVRFTVNGAPTQQICLYSANLYNNNARPIFALPIPAGSRLGGIQL